MWYFFLVMLFPLAIWSFFTDRNSTGLIVFYGIAMLFNGPAAFVALMSQEWRRFRATLSVTVVSLAICNWMPMEVYL